MQRLPRLILHINRIEKGEYVKIRTHRYLQHRQNFKISGYRILSRFVEETELIDNL